MCKMGYMANGEGREGAPTKTIPLDSSKRKFLKLFNPWTNREPKPNQVLPQAKAEVRLSRRGDAVAEISKQEGKYTVMYNDHVSPRNPEYLPDDLDALVIEGAAGNGWLDVTDRLSGSGITLEQRQARLKSGLPVERISDKDLKDPTIQRYKDRVEYKPLFPKLESRKTPLFVADMEFTPTWKLVDQGLSALDAGISHISGLVDRQLPGQRSTEEIASFLKKNLEVIKDSTVREIGKTRVFDAVVYPGVVALLELGVGATILANIIHEKKKMDRRGFLGKVLTGAKAVGASWLALPAVELSLFTSIGYQGEHLPPEQRKLVQSTHPETWLFILALRNVVLAQKEHWMMENLGIKNLGTTIGSAHTVLEDEIKKTSEERMALLQALKPLLLTMFDKESIYRIAKFGFDGKDWGLTDGYEVPELKALVGDKSEDVTEPRIPKSVVPGQDNLLESTALKEFEGIIARPLDLPSPAISQSVGERWRPGTAHLTDVKGDKEGIKLTVMYVVTNTNLHIGYRNTVGHTAYILSQDLKENLDIAPDNINPTIETFFLKDVKSRPPLNSGKEDEPYDYNSVVHRISFYADDRTIDRIIKEGCTILVSERGKDDPSKVYRDVYKAIPDFFKKQREMILDKK